MTKAKLTTIIDPGNSVIYPGQYLTVWLAAKTPSGFPRKQVELRVLDNGTPQIFVDGIKSKQFDTWKAES